MNILEKLKTVEITTDNRISEKDRQFCEAHQTAYREAKDALNELIYFWEEAVNRQHTLLAEAATSQYSLDVYISVPNVSIRDIKQKTEEIHSIFINRIVNHFNDVYKVSLDARSVENNLLPHKPKSDYYTSDVVSETQQYHQQLKEMTLDYKDILDQIFIQLGNRTFEEQALDEIKEKCHKFAWNTYCGTANFELKNNVICFTYGCDYEYWFGKDKWEIKKGMQNVIRGISHFETGVSGNYPSHFAELLGWDSKNKPIFEFPDCSILQLIKMYKNGRVDVKFKSKDCASRFVAAYLSNVC